MHKQIICTNSSVNFFPQPIITVSEKCCDLKKTLELVFS